VMTEQFWKQFHRGEMHYTRVVVPRGQEQSLPHGATKLTRAAYEQAMVERAQWDTQRAGESRASNGGSSEETRSLAVDELTQLGLSPSTVEALLGGVSRA